MNTAYWDLFWITGMPEAWLMSRDQGMSPWSGAVQGGGQGAPGPLAGSPSPLPSSVPGSPRNLY